MLYVYGCYSQLQVASFGIRVDLNEIETDLKTLLKEALFSYSSSPPPQKNAITTITSL